MITTKYLCFLLFALLTLLAGLAAHNGAAPVQYAPKQPAEKPVAVGGMGHSFAAHR